MPHLLLRLPLAPLLLVLLLLVSPLVRPALANGKGPIGIYAISDRYVLLADSNFDALIAVDLHRGGTVGTLKLHGPELDPPSSSSSFVGGTGKKVGRKWTDPTGVASCDTCRFVYVSSTGGDHFYEVELEVPLLEMARDGGDFARLSAGTVTPVWPWNGTNAATVGGPTSSVRMIEVRRDGRVGYMAYRRYGVLRFYLDEEGRIVPEAGDVLITNDDLGNPSGVVAGLTLTEDGGRLLVTASQSMMIVSFDEHGAGIANSGGTLREVVDLEGLCNGGNGNMWFRDAALVRNETAMYVVGLVRPGMNGNGMAVYRLRRDQNGEWGHCEAVAGPPKEHGGWRDGMGREARFTRPHEFTLLPRGHREDDPNGGGLHGDVLVVGDCDNRAVRLVELTSEPSHRVSTVSYDEGLWWTINVRATPEIEPDGHQPQRMPFVVSQSEDVMINASFVDAEWGCRSETDGAAELCTLAELRSNENETPFRFHDESQVFAVWTAESCQGCWLHWPGVCSSEGGWGSDYRMLAFFYADGRIKTECTHEEKNVVVAPICCGVSDEASRSRL